MKATYSILVLGILASHQGYVRSESNCDDNSKLQYEAGKSYVYNVEQISYDSTKDDWNDLESPSRREDMHKPRTRGRIITGGKVVLTALESCQFVMTLQNVATHISGERIGEVADSRNGTVPRTSMLFTFKNGEISNLYKQGGEDTIWSENILRGILTMIQNKGMGNSEGEPEEKETNIKGDCLSRIYLPQEGSYKKTIMTGQCSEPVITPSEGVPYVNNGPGAFRSHFHHSTSLLRCYNNVTDGLVSSVECTEMTDLPHFHKIHHRSETISTFNLEQAEANTEDVGGVTSDEISTLTEATCMKYDDRRAHADATWEKDVLAEALHLAETLYLETDLNKAELYLKLKEHLLFVKDFQKLEEMIQAISEDDSMKFQFVVNIVRNIATEIGTEGAVVYVSNLIHNKALNPGPVAVFQTHLHLAKDATLEGVKALNIIVQDTLDEYNNGGVLDAMNVFSNKKRNIRQQVLGVSAYAYHFCRKNPSCGDLPDYQTLIGNIAQFANSKQPDITHAALQALGNVPSLPDAAVKIIQDILNKGGSLFAGGEAKLLTAFEAFRRAPCLPTLKEASRNILNDQDVSVEIRITAYMALSRCLEEEDVTVISGILEKAPVSPISSFIASHVLNIMDSQSPSKNSQKAGLLSQIVIPDSVHSVHNMSTASKFVEYSTFHADKNLGFSAEAALLYQGDSIPNFVQVNWTVDAFGKSYNSLQLGISSRLMPSISKGKIASVMNFFDVHYNQAMVQVIPMFFAQDAYVRVFGTTVSMGADLMEALKAHQFFDHRKDDNSEVLRFDFVKAFTLLDHEVKVPTISGLPLTFTAQMAYLPMVSASHYGATNGIGFKDLLTKWDERSGSFAHNSTSDSAFVVGYDLSIGKGTPIHMGHHGMAKLRFNHSIGFESVMEESGWLKTIHFPDMTVASLRVTALRQFFVEYNGHEFKSWNMFGDTKPMAPEQLFKVGGMMGLKATGHVLSHCTHDKTSPFDVVVKIEKTEEGFTGYGLAIELKDESENTKKFGVKAMAYGLSTEDTLRVYVNYTDMGVHDIEAFGDKPSLDLVVYTDMTKRHVKPTGLLFKYNSQGHQKSALAENPNFSEAFSSGILSIPALGWMIRPEYSFELQTIDHGKKIKLVDCSVKNNKDDAVMTMKFSGPLENQVGDIEMKVNKKELGDPNDKRIRSRLLTEKDSEHGLEFKAEINQKSKDLGENKYTMDLAAKNGVLSVKRTLKLQEATYELTEHWELPKTVETFEEDGTTVKNSHMDARYKAAYNDSDGIKVVTTFEYNDHRDLLENNQVTSLQNASIRVVSGDSQDALIVEATRLRELDHNYELVHDGLKRKSINIYVDAFGKKQGELTLDHKYTEVAIGEWKDCELGTLVYLPKDGKNYRCRTHNKVVGLVVPNYFEFLSTFDNNQRHSLKKVITAYLTEPETKFNLTYDLDYPPQRKGMGLESKLAILVENVGEKKVDWKHDSNLDIDTENKTVEYNSETKLVTKKDDNEEAIWTTSATGNWDKDVIIGESALNIRHQCPRSGVTTIDILNRGNQNITRGEGTLWTNALSVTIDHQGRTKVFKPKTKYSWNFVSDTGLTKEEKTLYDFGWKWNSDVKLEKMLEQPQEVFSYRESVNFFKVIRKEIWEFKDGQFSLVRDGIEKAAGSWDMSFSVMPEGDHKGTSESTEVSHFAPTSPSSTNVKLEANMDAWFEQEVPAAQNNTLRIRYLYNLLPHDIRLKCNSDFVLRKTDMDSGKEVFIMDFKAMRDDYYKDLFHFNHYEKFNMNIDNKTWAMVKDIRMDGPHLTVHIVTDGETDEDSYLIDFDGGIFEEKHQHKINFQSKTGSKADHQNHHHHPHHQHSGIIPYTNFNMTVSR